jgi:predicted permease
MLSLLGCGAGLLLEAWTQHYLVRMAPATIPRIAAATVGMPVILFSILLSLATAVLFGLAPAWQVSQPDPSRALKSASRHIAGGAILEWQSALMLGQVAGSMVLLICAGLLIKSFFSLNRVNLGFRTDHVLAMNINLPKARYSSAQSRLAFFEDLAARVQSLPGVQVAAFANRMPMRGGWGGNVYLDSGANSPSTDDVDLQAVSTGYFRTLGIPLRRGRLFTSEDREGAPRAAVVSAEFERRYFPRGEAVGRRIRRGADAPWIAIVGVAGDIRRDGKGAPVTPQVYFPAAQTDIYPVPLADFAFRAAGDPKGLVAAVQRQVWAIDKNQPITGVKTLDEVIWDSQAQRRFQTLLLLLFAGLAAVLAALGIYGVIAYLVSQRTPEIGIRLALGAARGDILRLVMARVAGVVAAGIVLGAAGSYLASRSVQALLFATAPGDAPTYLAVALLFGGIALAACCLPALRATRIDPVNALRYE